MTRVQRLMNTTVSRLLRPSVSVLDNTADDHDLR
jgi:hypothetical protein